jgi:hypothetical protein
VLYESAEEREARRLVRTVQTFRLTNDGSYRRSAEVHEVRLFDRGTLSTWLEAEGFDVDSGTAYGSFELPRRRIAFTATRRA